ncbi:MAG: hypothetical protein ACR2LE_03890 [Nocardioidaceae bacterium]
MPELAPPEELRDATESSAVRETSDGSPPFPRWVMPFAMLAVVALRLPFLTSPASPDEAGFLTVARQWHAGGSSLYGSYWVDRPPLLLSIFQLAGATGGPSSLRLLGCVAAAVTVLSVSVTAGRIAGPRAAGWSAIFVATLLVSPLMGTDEVNGELLAAPFVSTGILLAVTATNVAATRSRMWTAAGAGACGAAALLVKQNMAEVFVFGLVAWLVSYWTERMNGHRLVQCTIGATLGAVGAVALVAAWTVHRGTDLSGVFDAMYQFRLKAAQVVAPTDVASATRRLLVLFISWLLAGGPVVLAAFAWALITRRLRGPVAWGLLATCCFTVVSVLAGGGYASHYLVETIVPLGLVVALLSQLRLRLALCVVSVAAIVAAGAWTVSLLEVDEPTAGASIGSAIGTAAGPADTIISALGYAEIVERSGLPSPYPYLWSLPARTLDPHMNQLTQLMRGPAAPTWFVVAAASTNRSLEAGVTTVLRQRYRPVVSACGRTIYLHDGRTRAIPPASDLCQASGHSATDVLMSWVRTIPGI